MIRPGACGRTTRASRRTPHAAAVAERHAESLRVADDDVGAAFAGAARCVSASRSLPTATHRAGGVRDVRIGRRSTTRAVIVRGLHVDAEDLGSERARSRILEAQLMPSGWRARPSTSLHVRKAPRRRRHVVAAAPLVRRNISAIASAAAVASSEQRRVGHSIPVNRSPSSGN
jgi:hypothetical protein